MKLTRLSAIHGNPTMHRKLLSILGLSILMASTLIGCGQGQPAVTPAIFSTSGGNVSVMKTGTDNWTEAEVGMCLEHGDCIKCGGNSGAEITFLDGSTIELQPGTEIEIISLDISTETDSATIRLKQTIGTIVFRVVKIVDPASRYEVETPAGVVAIRGSAVQITVTEDGTTWICNLEGDIWAVAQGVELHIPEGRCCIIRPGQSPTLICDLTISSTTGGSVAMPGEGIFPYDEGTEVDLVAAAEEGYRFVSWTGDVSTVVHISAASTIITMTSNWSIVANFEKMYYTLTVATDGSGSTSPSVGQHTYAAGTVVSISAFPSGGYFFVNWTGDVDTIADVNVASTTVTVNGDYSITANFEEAEVTFTDPNLEAAVRQAISKPEGPIYASDLNRLIYLDASAKNITDLTGLECATSLTHLFLRYNEISDVSPLASLTSLIQLYLWSNQVSDISALANLTSLTFLDLMYNQIDDISPLANLSNLTTLVAAGNQISDISPLADLTSLTGLNLGQNQITDIRSLANLTSLTFLHLGHNQITDISPLVDNEGLSDGDQVYLQGNPLNSDSADVYVPELQARGVTVNY